MKESHILKVQVSIYGKPGTLIFNKDRSIMERADRSLGEKLLGKQQKTFSDFKDYFHATYDTETGIVEFSGERAKAQDW